MFPCLIVLMLASPRTVGWAFWAVMAGDALRWFGAACVSSALVGALLRALRRSPAGAVGPGLVAAGFMIAWFPGGMHGPLEVPLLTGLRCASLLGIASGSLIATVVLPAVEPVLGSRDEGGICAADPRYWGPGSVVWIGPPINQTFTVEDTGGAVKGEDHFDMCVGTSHAACSKIGVRRNVEYVVLYRAAPRSRWGRRPSGYRPPLAFDAPLFMPRVPEGR